MEVTEPQTDTWRRAGRWLARVKRPQSNEYKPRNKTAAEQHEPHNLQTKYPTC